MPHARPTRLPVSWLFLAPLFVFLEAPAASAFPAEAYDVEFISHEGATYTNVRGVDSGGRILGYWARFDSPGPFPIPIGGVEPTESGYSLWENGVEQAFSIPGLTNFNIHGMNVDGAMWGDADEGRFIYRDGSLEFITSPDADVAVVQGLDASGRAYGFHGNYPPGTDPNSNLVPVLAVSSFGWENDTFSDLDILLDGGILFGVRQDGALWGSNAQDAFIQIGMNITILDHPDYDYTSIGTLTGDGDVFGHALTIDGQNYSSIDFFWNPVDGFTAWPEGENLPGTSVRPGTFNENGVGWGGSGNNSAYVATPIPEPGSALLVAAGLLAQAFYRRSR